MSKYAFKVTLNYVYNFVVKDAALSDIFEAKRIANRIENEYKEENVRIDIDEYRHGDEFEEVEDLYMLEEELVSKIKSDHRHAQEVLDKLKDLSNLLDSAIDSHYFDETNRRISCTLSKLEQKFYFHITVDDFSDFKIVLVTDAGKESSIIRRTIVEVVAEILNVQDILSKIELLASGTEFDLL